MNQALSQPVTPRFTFDNSYARLPEVFYARIEPTPVAQPTLLRLNHSLASQLGLDVELLATDTGAQILAGNLIPPGAEPLAMAYAGHQYGQFVPSLGDGRAILLGELIDRDGIRRDLHLKGSGRTPFSRMGDGRAVLGPVLREYVLGEAMQGLGIPTTRALAMVATGEEVYRERIEPGAILVRVAAGHTRVGTFEYFARRDDREAVRHLADYVIARHYPACRDADRPYRALLEQVVQRQAELIARWMLVGFIHGVMNTDNTAISGETIDYGPCAFIDAFDPKAVYSSIDRFGRYAWDQQPSTGLWNLTQLANCLLPLLGEDEHAAQKSARAALDTYGNAFEQAYYGGLRAKIGLADARAGDDDLALDLLGRMAQQQADFTNTFRELCALSADDPSTDGPVRELFDDPGAFDDWAQQWRERLAVQTQPEAERQAAMRAVNPAYIPRNHRVQEAIDAAEQGDLAPLDRLLEVVSTPFDEHPDCIEYRRPPQPHEIIERTFCGT
ncbi:MAG: YdiU family protein [Gammaproteobacteria bacterium]|jgi:uncharacterized protein YdiU (UPF0061 family)|nr:YdiU family protein [Gammaproteobacteria bacterium]